MRIQKLTAEEVARFQAIRLRALADASDAFGTTWEEATAWPHEVWTALFSGLTALVAVAGDHDVGLVRGGPERGADNAARLGSLWVAPEARGTGAGVALINAVVDWARSMGFAELFLDVTDDNVSAIALYTRMGFEPTGEVGTLPPPRDHVLRHQRVLRL